MKKVFSFTLFGSQEKYWKGLLVNINLIHEKFPDWEIWVYIGNDVPSVVLFTLKSYSDVKLIETQEIGMVNKFFRFFPIDEHDVEICIIRDADSRIHWKDRWAIREFVKHPEFIAHTIRDNIEHTASMMGGLWGIRKSAGLTIRDEYSSYKEDTEKGHRQGHDQNFLGDVIYPKVVYRMLVHYSNNRRKIGENAVEFPFNWVNDTYCGRIELEYLEYPEPPMKRPSIYEPPKMTAPAKPLNFLFKK